MDLNGQYQNFFLKKNQNLNSAAEYAKRRIGPRVRDREEKQACAFVCARVRMHVLGVVSLTHSGFLFSSLCHEAQTNTLVDVVPTHGSLEILMDLNFIHPWRLGKTGPKLDRSSHLGTKSLPLRDRLCLELSTASRHKWMGVQLSSFGPTTQISTYNYGPTKSNLATRPHLHRFL